MTYNLGAVKPHVSEAANYFGPKYGIKTVYGYRAVGSVPGSDHPRGLALDYMTSSKSVGDALAEDLIRNASQWGITYVIWYRRIWDKNSGWKAYSGPSPHTDHVHASHSASPGTGGTVEYVDNPLVPDKIEAVYEFVKNLEDMFGEMTRREFWMRLVYMLTGMVIVIVAIYNITKGQKVTAKIISKVKDSS